MSKHWTVPSQTERKAAYLHSIAWQFGEPRSFLAENHANPTLIDRTQREGIDGYYQADCRPWELAGAAAVQTLALASFTPSDVDYIIYSTESTDSRVDISRDPNRFAELLGMPTTPLIAVTGNVCANFGAALSVARNAVLFGDHDVVLIVTTDIWDERPRLVDAGTCLMSDAAASAIVSLRAPGRGWEVGKIVSAVEHSMHSVDPGLDTMDMVRGTVSGLQRVYRNFFRDIGPNEYDHIVAGNLGDTVLKMFAALGKFDDRKILRQTALNGHCLAADVLVNLSAFSSQMVDGDRVLGFSSGHNYWTCIDLALVD